MARASGEPDQTTGKIKISQDRPQVMGKSPGYAVDSTLCVVNSCKFITAGLRLSQEVELLRKENFVLRQIIEAMKSGLKVSGPESSLGV